MLQSVNLRGFLVITIVAISARGIADWTIDFPSAYTLRSGEVRLEYREVSGKSRDEWILNCGILPFFEIRIKSSDAQQVDFQYSITQPYPEVAPGIAIGIFDAFDKGETGRSIYVATTFQFNVVADWSKRERGNLTIGIGTGELRKGAFVGVSMPIFPRTILLAEIFKKHQTIGLDLELTKGVGIRAMVRDGIPSFSIQFRRLY